MTDTYRYGILSGGIGSFDSIQWTNNVSGGTQTEILDSSRNLTNINSLSASSFVSASSFEVDGQASISYDSSALDLSTGGAAAKLSTTEFSASVELQGSSLYTAGAAKLSGGLSASSARVADLSENRIVFAGAGGELQDSAEFKFQSNTLTVSGSTFSRDVVIAGDLTVAGTTTTVQSTEVTIADKALVVASGSNDAQIAAAGGAGIKVGGESGQSFLYDGSDSWDSSENMNLASGKTYNIADANMLDADGAAKVRSAVAGDGLGHSAGVLAVNVDDSSIQIDSDSLQIKALGVTNAMLAGSIASTKIAELNNFNTGDLAEGSNLYYTDARARAAISGTDNGGDGSFSYNQSTGEISYTGPSASETRAHFSAADFITLTDGEISVDATEFTSSARSTVSVTDNGGDGSLSYDSSTGVISYTGPSASEVRAHLSVTDSGGDGSLSYNSSTGVITYTGPSASEVRAHFSGDAGIDLSDGAISVNVDDSGIEINSDTLRLASSALAGTTDEVEVSYSNGQFTIGLPDDVTVTGSFTADNGQFDTDLNVGLGILTVEDGNFSVGTIADFGDTLNVQGSATFEANATITGSLTFDTGVSVSEILDEDDMNSNSDTALATQQSIKAYVDSVASSGFTLSDGTTDQTIGNGDTFTVEGTANEIEVAVSATDTLTIGLPDSVTIASNLTVNGNTTLGNDQSSDSVTFNAQLLASSTSVDIGSDDNRFGDVYATNVYTGDFHMKNERGDWTLFEESDHIRIRNNATGQEFKLDMTPVEE